MTVARSTNARQPAHQKPDGEERLRAQEAVKLRAAGMPYYAIADRLGYADESGARKAVDRLLSRVDHEQVGELRQLEGRRLDQLQQAHWVAALQGDVDAARIVLGVIDRRAKLFGLNMPVKVQVGADPMTDVEWANQLSGLIDSLGVDGLAEAMAALPGTRGYGHEIVDAEVVTEADAKPTDTTIADGEGSPASDPQVPSDGHPLRVAPVVSPGNRRDRDGSAPRRQWSNVV